MKRVFKTIPLFLSVIVLFCMSGCGKNDETSLEQKVNTEITYLDNELVSMVNELNNINYFNYRVDTQELNDDSQKGGESESEGSQSGQGSSQEKESENSGGGGSESSGGQSEGKSQDKGDSSNQSSNSKSEESDSQEKKYAMNFNGTLGSEPKINWDELRGKTEKLYPTWTVILSDLSKVGVPSSQLDEFSNSVDMVAVAAKNEDANVFLDELLKLYALLPEFAKSYGGDKERNVIYSKYNLLVCYKYAMLEDWESLNRAVENLKMSFSNVSDKKELYSGKEGNIERAATIIRKMENSGEINDKDVFFIKYKNLIQELDLICE